MTGGSEYVRSVFTVILPYCGRYFLWNTMSGAVKKLKAENEEGAVSEARELFEAVQSSPAAMSEWIDSGFFVPRDWDELDVIDEDLRADHAGGFFRIMTTGACNASCRYCYILTEAGHMTNSTAVRTAAFVADRYERDPYRMPPLIEWFGGFCARHPDNRPAHMWLLDNLIDDRRLAEARDRPRRLHRTGRLRPQTAQPTRLREVFPFANWSFAERTSPDRRHTSQAARNPSVA